MSREKGRKQKKRNRGKQAKNLEQVIDNGSHAANKEEYSAVAEQKNADKSNMLEEAAVTAEAAPVYRADILSESRGGSKTGKVFMVIAVVTVALVAAVLGGVRFFYGNHWYAGTTIAGKDVSGMGLEESKQVLAEVYATYQLRIKGRDGGEMIIDHTDIDYHSQHEDAIEEAFREQHADFQLLELLGDNNIVLDVNGTYNEQELEDCIASSELLNGSSQYEIVKPKDAYVDFEEGQSYLSVIPEVKGNKLKRKPFLAAVKEALDHGVTELDLTDDAQYGEIYKQPEITKEDEQLKQEVELWNAAVLRWIVWKIDNEKKIVVSPSQIYDWCFVKNDKIKYRRQKIRDWMEEVCLEYKTVGVTRKFKNHEGKKITVEGGDYGWSFDYEKMVSQLMNGLKKEIDYSLQEAYMEDDTSDNKKALTIKKEPVYLGMAFQRNYEDKSKDWDTKNFTEVSLEDQMVYVWRNGKIKFQCECITGRPVPERQTKTGAYFIKEHQTSRVLRGDDYETPVTYWVRIMWSGTGFHEAHWQPWSRWSKTLYLSRGSHGCINLSPENAKKIYEMVNYREMVFIY